MKNFRYLFLWIVLPMLSCEKQDNNSDNGKDPITDVYDNAYFPLDVNDQWIYSSTICLFDDVADSIDDNYCATSIDTIIPGPKKLMGNIVAVKFGAKYFNTQYNKVSLIIDTNTVFKQQYIITSCILIRETPVGRLLSTMCIMVMQQLDSNKAKTMMIPQRKLP